MSDASGQVWITFNGEIYNYQDLRRDLTAKGHCFRTVSDTEVILAAYREWGISLLSRLDGMFAFGLYDRTIQRLFLARDRAGEKPLFYWHTSDQLVFASELKALMSLPTLPRRIDLEGLEYYLAYGYVPGDKCILRDVRKLAPAHAAVYDCQNRNLHIWRYWQLPDPAPDRNTPVGDLVAEFESLLEDSVRRRLVADVPVGVLLSGGLDSSLVTAIAAKVSSGSVKTFTIGFPGHGVYDESPYARMVAQHFATEHIELAAEPATVDLLPSLALQYDEPIADSSMVPTYLVSRLVRQHAKVALGGDGGDELFGGYPHYSWIQRQEHVRRWLPSNLRRLAGLAAAHWMPVGQRGRNHVIGFADDLPWSIAHVNLYFDSLTRSRLLKPLRDCQPRGLSPEVFRAGLCLPHHSPLRQATGADFQTTMVDAYLVKVDRASMLNSLELRAPFLDHRLVEFAFGRVPDNSKVTEKERKILPRLLGRRLLPAQLDLTRKQGFSMPLTKWFGGNWGTYIESVLNEASPQLFCPHVIQNLIKGQHRGLANTQRLFSLTIFELWRRQYNVATPF